jgi:hypothetical protein
MSIPKEQIIASLEKKNKDPKVKDPRMTPKDEYEEKKINQDFIDKLYGGVERWHFIEIGADKIPVRLLSRKETDDIARQALAWFMGLPEIERDPRLLARREATLTLFKAMSRSPGCTDPDHLLWLNMETVESIPDVFFVNLFNEYKDHCQKYDLNIDTLSDDEYKQILEFLKKKEVSVKQLSRLRLEQILERLFSDLTSLMDKLHTQLLQDTSTTI